MSDKIIFTIMPFSKANSRNENKLTEFFELIKTALEKESSFHYRYKVDRSGKHLYIHEKLFEDVYNADIVLCDLSGEIPNHNVMFELGIRLAWSNKPVILFREEKNKNLRIFDVDGLHIENYKTKQSDRLIEYIINEIKEIEKNSKWESPVFKILKSAPTVLYQIRKNSALSRLRMLIFGIGSYLAAYTGNVSEFINSQIKFAFSENTLEFFKEFDTNKEKFHELDWSKFNFMNISFPALESYLIDPFLEEFVSEDIHKIFTLYAVTFYNKVVNTEAIPVEGKIIKVHGSLYECLLFHNMALSIWFYINKDEEKERHLHDFNDWFDRSPSKSYIMEHTRFLDL